MEHKMWQEKANDQGAISTCKAYYLRTTLEGIS
jgi:hypothetical protein